MTLPSPPGGKLDVPMRAWARLRPIYRVGSAAYLPNAFNSTDTPGRFRPLRVAGTIVPTLYGANRVDGCLGESVFHDVPANGGPWVMPRAKLYGYVRTTLIPLRELLLVDLAGWAHKRLRLDGRALIESGPADYAVTAEWARRFHDLTAAPDGLYWISRQFDGAQSVMLFGDRVDELDLEPVLDETLALWEGVGLEEVQVAAARADVTIAVS
jgi:hypothetical protein